jgi:hypothetical protein
LLEAGISVTSQVYSTASSRDYTNPISIPRISETGSTVGLDSTASQVNIWAGGAPSVFAGFPGGFANTSGSLNTKIGEGAAEVRDNNNYRTRASLSYVTGSHHAKFGYEGGYYTQLETNEANQLGLTYLYFDPAATANCNIPGTCGNMSLQFPNDPNNLARRPFPQYVSYNTGTATLDDRVKYTALYAQDQWTLKRITASFALRYDHATSSYGQTVFPASLPTMQYSLPGFTVPASDGVNYNDITPRLGATWDVRGNGKTSVKVNWGKYLNAATISGVYSGANPARRTVNQLTRAWNDTNGDRKVNCDLLNPAPNGECGGFALFNADFIRRRPDAIRKESARLDAGGTQSVSRRRSAAGRNRAFRRTFSVLQRLRQVGARWMGLPPGKRSLVSPPARAAAAVVCRNHLQPSVVQQHPGVRPARLGLRPVQWGHLPPGVRPGPAELLEPVLRFLLVTAPTDPNLPGGGGYKILGLNDVKTAAPFGLNTAQTYLTRSLTFQGVDTNFNWRGPKGIRIQAGSSTGAVRRDLCRLRSTRPTFAGEQAPSIWQAAKRSSRT